MQEKSIMIGNFMLKNFQKKDSHELLLAIEKNVEQIDISLFIILQQRRPVPFIRQRFFN